MHLLNILCGLSAVLGLILLLGGRWMMVASVGDVGLMWKLALRFLPFADLLFLSRYWDLAKNGAFTSLAGMIFLLPWAGKAICEKNELRKTGQLYQLDHDAKAGLYESMKAQHQTCIEWKEQNVARLNACVSGWYQTLQTRRATLTGATPAQRAAYEEEAAAYIAFRELALHQAGELNTLRAQPFEFADLKNEDFTAWIERQRDSRTGSPRGMLAKGGAPESSSD